MAKTVHHSTAGTHRLLRAVEAHGMRMGRSGNKRWLYVGTAMWTLRTMRRLAERREEILISETLKPGQRLIIANARPTLGEPDPKPKAPRTKRGRKKLAKAQAKTAKAQAKADAKAARKEAELQAKRDVKAAKKAKKVKPIESVPVS
ncbi:hypothetical protein [Aquihabitans sp. McL0605]|uniref:hypothetical protein n=1 Tax=Aquihabitans sp. McL0605 TaxID=3415671 RepID=UPI003CF5E16F